MIARYNIYIDHKTKTFCYIPNFCTNIKIPKYTGISLNINTPQLHIDSLLKSNYSEISFDKFISYNNL